MHAWVLLLWLGSTPELGRAQAERLDALHALRDDEAARQEALALAAEAEKEPPDFELLWRAARVHCWEAERKGATSEATRREAEACWHLADAASALEPKRAEGFLWAAQGVGMWARENGVIQAILAGVETRITERLDQAIRNDATLDHGAPWLLRGAVAYELPWPKQDLKRAKQLISTATTRFPDNLRARLYLARILLDTGDRTGAVKALEEIEAASPGYDPPSARLVKAEARVLVAKLRTP